MALITVEDESARQANIKLMKVSILLSVASLVVTYALHKDIL